MRATYLAWMLTFSLAAISPFVSYGETCKGETKDGLKIGLWKCYYATGTISQEGYYEMGKKKGIWKLYHDNGKLAGEGNFADDKEQGKWKFFDEEGNLMLEQDFGG